MGHYKTVCMEVHHWYGNQIECTQVYETPMLADNPVIAIIIVAAVLVAAYLLIKRFK